ncbi:CDP-diacylglycerol--serine O-phosphatidyltransferase [bacterium]
MKKSVYVLPSLFTLGNLSAGFFSIIFSFEHAFTKAAWAILIAGAFDFLDGKVARMTKTTSQFGVEFDSIADIVSSGVAPAVMIYILSLHRYPTWGKIICLVYLVAGALRLARFNTNKIVEDPRYFRGLPLPAAAGVLASFVIVYNMFEREITRKAIPILMNKMPLFYEMIPLGILLLSYLMISNIRYSSFKGVRLIRPKTIQNLIMIFVALLLIWRFPENMILIVFSAYLLSGILGLLLRFLKIRKIH